jgi:hypothetical protein
VTARTLRRAAAAAVAGTLAVTALVGGQPAGATGAKAKSYQAPFAAGPNGGDSFSYHSAGKDGTVTVGRVYPIPGAINCSKGGPYAKLLVQHHPTGQVRKVVVSYDSAAVDNFTFVMVGLRAGHDWLGTTTERGFVTGSGEVTLKPDRLKGPLPRTLTVEFGLQQSSACPNADAGTIRFTKVQVFS